MIKGYLDNAASTECKFFAKDFYIPGNPNSPTAIGRKAHEALEQAKQRIKDCLGVNGGEVVFCRCATDAVKGIISAMDLDDPDMMWHHELLCSPYEHDSSYIGTESKEFFPCTLFLHQHVNQITGSVFDIEPFGRRARERGAYFGSDFTASIGHARLPDNLEEYCDLVYFSGHKFHAEQGIGALWMSDRFVKGWSSVNNPKSLLTEIFPGTPNVSGAVAMSYAMKHAIEKFELDNMWQVYFDLWDYLESKLWENDIDHKFINGDFLTTSCSYTINAVMLTNINADALVQFLSSRGVYISAGHSACSGDSPDASRVLEAFGLSKEEASQTVRISFCEDSTLEEVDMLVNGIVEFREKFMD